MELVWSLCGACVDVLVHRAWLCRYLKKVADPAGSSIASAMVRACRELGQDPSELGLDGMEADDSLVIAPCPILKPCVLKE